jgi:hypothetical protein
VTGTLVNVQREALLLYVKIEELPATRDVRGAQVRRALLANQLTQLRSLGGGDPLVDATVDGVDQDLALIDRALARAEAAPAEAGLRAETERMRPVIRRATVRIKQLYDTKEQGFFGVLSTALEARRSSERQLVGLSGLVLIVGLASPCRCASGSAGTSPGPIRRSPPRSRSARRPSGRCGPARSGSGRWSGTPRM